MTSSDSRRGKLEAEFRFTAHMQNSVAGGRLTPAKHKAGDWLQLLSDAELDSLMAVVNFYQEGLEAGDEVCPLVANLMFLETGKTVVNKPIEFLADVFAVIITIEDLRREGYIELKQTLSINDAEGTFSLTRKGMQFEDQITELFR